MQQVKLLKLLILLIIFGNIAACSDSSSRPDIDKTDGALVTSIELEVILYDSFDDLAEAFSERNDEIDYRYTLEGYAEFIRNGDGTGKCWVHIVEPQEVDGEHTLTLGHEVAHCMYGLYHQ
jgi:hypothetical protein